MKPSAFRISRDSLPKPQMKAIQTSIPGLLQLSPLIWKDPRGSFVKTFHCPQWEALGLTTTIEEEYYTRSIRGVVRGMHFQVPPMQHIKVVSCLQGEVLDVVIDLRRGSPTFGRYHTFHLLAEMGDSIYIPEGLAHGFCTLSEEAILYYRVSTPHSPEHDKGILWSSIGLDWPILNPIISSRDGTFPPLAEFESPFKT